MQSINKGSGQCLDPFSFYVFSQSINIIMKRVRLTTREYYEFVQIAKFAFVTLGVAKGIVMVEANVELLKQIGY